MPRLGCTYAYGLTSVETVEVDTTRERGLFTQYDGVRMEGSAELQLPGALIDPASASWIVWLEPLVSSGASGATVRRLIRYMSDDLQDSIGTWYASGSWHTGRTDGGAGASVSVAQALAVDDAVVVYGGADATSVVGAVNGGAISSVANAATGGVPTGDIGLGYSRLATEPGDFRIAGAVFFNRLLTAAEWGFLARLRRPPCHGEGGTGAAMVGSYLAADTIVRVLATDGVCYDLNGGSLVLTTLAGAGPGPSLHRMAASPFRSGAILIDTLGEVRKMVASVAVISEANPTTIWDLRRGLAHNINPRLGLGVIQCAPDDKLYEIDAVLDQEGAGFAGLKGPHLLETDLPFLCPGPDWRGMVRNGYTDVVIPASGWSLPWVLPWVFSAATVTSTITIEGDVPSYPVITITAGSGGAFGPAVTNAATGERFAMLDTFEMPADSVLVIDMGNRTAELDGVPVLSQRDPETTMWALAPGDIDVEVTVTSGDAISSVRVVPLYVGI